MCDTITLVIDAIFEFLKKSYGSYAAHLIRKAGIPEGKLGKYSLEILKSNQFCHKRQGK